MQNKTIATCSKVNSRWRFLPDEEKSIYVEMEREDGVRYKKETNAARLENSKDKQTPRNPCRKESTRRNRPGHGPKISLVNASNPFIEVKCDSNKEHDDSIRKRKRLRREPMGAAEERKKLREALLLAVKEVQRTDSKGVAPTEHYPQGRLRHNHGKRKCRKTLPREFLRSLGEKSPGKRKHKSSSDKRQSSCDEVNELENKNSGEKGGKQITKVQLEMSKNDSLQNNIDFEQDKSVLLLSDTLHNQAESCDVSSNYPRQPLLKEVSLCRTEAGNLELDSSATLEETQMFVVQSELFNERMNSPHKIETMALVEKIDSEGDQTFEVDRSDHVDMYKRLDGEMQHSHYEEASHVEIMEKHAMESELTGLETVIPCSRHDNRTDAEGINDPNDHGTRKCRAPQQPKSCIGTATDTFNELTTRRFQSGECYDAMTPTMTPMKSTKSSQIKYHLIYQRKSDVTQDCEGVEKKACESNLERSAKRQYSIVRDSDQASCPTEISRWRQLYPGTKNDRFTPRRVACQRPEILNDCDLLQYSEYKSNNFRTPFSGMETHDSGTRRILFLEESATNDNEVARNLEKAFWHTSSEDIRQLSRASYLGKSAPRMRQYGNKSAVHMPATPQQVKANTSILATNCNYDTIFERTPQSTNRMASKTPHAGASFQRSEANSSTEIDGTEQRCMFTHHSPSERERVANNCSWFESKSDFSRVQRAISEENSMGEDNEVVRDLQRPFNQVSANFPEVRTPRNSSPALPSMPVDLTKAKNQGRKGLTQQKTNGVSSKQFKQYGATRPTFLKNIEYEETETVRKSVVQEARPCQVKCASCRPSTENRHSTPTCPEHQLRQRKSKENANNTSKVYEEQCCSLNNVQRLLDDSPGIHTDDNCMLQPVEMGSEVESEQAAQSKGSRPGRGGVGHNFASNFEDIVGTVSALTSERDEPYARSEESPCVSDAQSTSDRTLLRKIERDDFISFNELGLEIDNPSLHVLVEDSENVLPRRILRRKRQGHFSESSFMDPTRLPAKHPKVFDHFGAFLRAFKEYINQEGHQSNSRTAMQRDWNDTQSFNSVDTDWYLNSQQSSVQAENREDSADEMPVQLKKMLFHVLADLEVAKPRRKMESERNESMFGFPRTSKYKANGQKKNDFSYSGKGKRHYQRAIDFRQSKSMRESTKEFKRCLEIREYFLGRYHCDTADAYYNIGYNLYVEGKYDNAIPAFRVWLRSEIYLANTDLKSQNPNQIKFTINCLYKQRLTRQQIRLFFASLKYSVTFEKLGDAYRQKGDFLRAISSYQKAISMEKEGCFVAGSEATLAFLWRKMAFVMGRENDAYVGARVDWRCLDRINSEGEQENLVTSHCLEFSGEIAVILKQGDSFMAKSNYQMSLETYQRACDKIRRGICDTTSFIGEDCRERPLVGHALCDCMPCAPKHKQDTSLHPAAVVHRRSDAACNINHRFQAMPGLMTPQNKADARQVQQIRNL